MDILQNWQELAAGFLSGMLALLGVVYSVRRASARQLMSRALDQRATSNAVTEWYYGKIADLKTYLFKRCFDIGRLYDAMPPSAAYLVEDLEALVDLQIGAMTGADTPPDLLNANMATQFSAIENPLARGIITILTTQTSRFFDADRYSLQEFRAALWMLDPEDYADAQLIDQFKTILKGQLGSNRIILATAEEALEELDIEIEFLREWQARMDAEVQTVYAKAGLDVE